MALNQNVESYTLLLGQSRVISKRNLPRRLHVVPWYRLLCPPGIIIGIHMTCMHSYKSTSRFHCCPPLLLLSDAPHHYHSVLPQYILAAISPRPIHSPLRNCYLLLLSTVVVQLSSSTAVSAGFCRFWTGKRARRLQLYLQCVTPSTACSLHLFPVSSPLLVP